MSDRRQLEEAEARVLLASYWHNVRIYDKQKASAWLKVHIKRLEKIYGAGFDERVRKEMRRQQDEFEGVVGGGT